MVRLFIGFITPKRSILGSDLSGEIEAVGSDARRFKVGDQVFGGGSGTHAEYICLRDDGLCALKPVNMTFEEAAAVPFGALSALHFLRRANVRKGRQVLIYGASGGVGTAAVQLAKHFGAEVTGVCSTANLSLVKSLGADQVIDYTKEDFAKPAAFDVIFDTVGKSSFFKSLKSLRRGGVYDSAVAIGAFPRRFWASLSGRRMVGGIANPKYEDLVFLKGFIEEGKLKSVIDRRYPLDQIVEAHRYIETGHKKGNVVIPVAQARM